MNRGLAQERVREYWNDKPCESELSDRDPLSREYFLDIERQRYELQPHILDVLSKIDWSGKRVLEIGAGVGTDARRIIARGGLYTGINVDRGSTLMASEALRLFSLPGAVLQGSATALDFPDDTFDVVYSFGVLHHIPEVARAVAEIKRVLKPGGELLVMLYNRSSINYVVEIMFLRKLGLRILSVPGALAFLPRLGIPRDKLKRHLELRRQVGRMTDEEWLSRNTDGPDNPYSRVYDAKEAAQLLEAFQIEKNEVFFFDHRHRTMPGHLLPKVVRRALGRNWGWHRVIYAKKP
ncbi:MAG TPA: class I SAM-dependent methyltransferase [Burkholderiales bacterium]|nr:class I SAM-dependent methyltransferase [Burkholderiales bacterium]